MADDDKIELITTEEVARLLVAVVRGHFPNGATQEQIEPFFNEVYDWAERVRIDETFLQTVLDGRVVIGFDSNLDPGHEDRLLFSATPED